MRRERDGQDERADRDARDCSGQLEAEQERRGHDQLRNRDFEGSVNVEGEESCECHCLYHRPDRGVTERYPSNVRSYVMLVTEIGTTRDSVAGEAGAGGSPDFRLPPKAAPYIGT